MTSIVKTSFSPEMPPDCSTRARPSPKSYHYSLDLSRNLLRYFLNLCIFTKALYSFSKTARVFTSNEIDIKRKFLNPPEPTAETNYFKGCRDRLAGVWLKILCWPLLTHDGWKCLKFCRYLLNMTLDCPYDCFSWNFNQGLTVAIGARPVNTVGLKYAIVEA